MAMASLAAASVSVPSFCGLRAEAVRAPPAAARANAQMARSAPAAVCRASMDLVPKMGKALLAASAGVVLLAASANAATVKMGGDDGTLKFVPESLSVAAGETITFKNNNGFPHNIVFEEDGVPAGVKADAISHDDYFNGAGEEFSVTLTEKGTYQYYCEPHLGGGMKGEITVS